MLQSQRHWYLDKLVTLYDEILSDIIDQHAPLKTKFVQVRPNAPWMTSEIINERRIKRMLVRRWRYRKTDESKQVFKDQMKKYNKLLNGAHTEYYSNLVLENSNNPGSLFNVIDILLNNTKKLTLPDRASLTQLASTFGIFLREK